MTSELFYPYATAKARLRFAVAPVGEQEIPRSPDGSLLLYQVDCDAFDLEVSLVLPDRLEEAVLPTSEHGTESLVPILVVRSVESRFRKGEQLSGDGQVFAGKITLERKHHFGEIRLQAVVLRRDHRDAVPDGFARARGSVLAWSDELRLLFDEPRQPPGNFLMVEWLNFREAKGWLQEHQNDLFALDWSGGLPKIVLNSQFPTARTILSHTGTRGPKAAIRDSTYFRIAHQAWTSIFAHVLEQIAVRVNEGEISSSEAYEDLAEWERAVIRGWWKNLFPALGSEEEAIEQLVQYVRDNRGSELLIKVLPNAIQERLGSNRGYESLVREVLRA